MKGYLGLPGLGGHADYGELHGLGSQKEHEGKGKLLPNQVSRACIMSSLPQLTTPCNYKPEETSLKTVSCQVFVIVMGKVTAVQPMHRAGPKVTGLRKQ